MPDNQPASKSGFLLIADISGYTSFLTDSELDHAREITDSLFKRIHKNIRKPLNISNYQGDAVLVYVEDQTFVEGRTLLDIVEQIYFDFRRAIETMKLNTTCTCKACRNMSALDLKFAMHHGEFVFQQLGGRNELMGPDVIAVHRLLKNTVKEKTGLEAYLLVTRQAADKMHLHSFCEGLKDHSEEFEHIGKLQLCVHCLHTAYDRYQKFQKKELRASSKGEWVVHTVDMPVPPPVVWDAVIRPEFKEQWMMMDSVGREDDLGPSYGPGTKYHCAHGEMGDIRYELLDWRPFDYITVRGITPQGVTYTQTEVFEPVGEGTRMTTYMEPWAKGLLKPMINRRNFRKYQEGYEQAWCGVRDNLAQKFQTDWKNGLPRVEN